MVSLTNFGFEVGVCIVNVMISIKKSNNFFRISFDKLLNNLYALLNVYIKKKMPVNPIVLGTMLP